MPHVRHRQPISRSIKFVNTDLTWITPPLAPGGSAIR